MTTYKIEFSVCGKVLASNTVTATNNIINYAIPQDITLMPIVESVVGIQVIGNNGENIIKSPIVEAYIGSSLQDSTVVASDSPSDIGAQIEQLMTAKHTHDNKSVLDKFAEGDDGKPTYNGIAIGGGTGGGSTGSELFIVNVQAQSGADAYTITSHDKTYTQIDEAYKAGKQVWTAFTITDENTTYLIPLVSATETDYEFSMFLGAVFTVYVDSTEAWDCYVGELNASSIQARLSEDATAPSASLQTILDYIVYPAVEKAHEHNNKSILDHFSDSNGALKYNGNFIIPQKISEGSSYITLADNTEYRLTDVTTLTLTYPTGNFECWMRLTFAASGTITVTLPAETKYIGTAPDFKNGETWELSFKDKVLAAQKVGEGT